MNLWLCDANKSRAKVTSKIGVVEMAGLKVGH